jgi:hypothetical protein
MPTRATTKQTGRSIDRLAVRRIRQAGRNHIRHAVQSQQRSCLVLDPILKAEYRMRWDCNAVDDDLLNSKTY